MAHILVVDDDELLRKPLVRTLMLDRHQVTEGLGTPKERQNITQIGIELVVTGTVEEHESLFATIGMLADAGRDFPVVALGGGRGLLKAGLTADAATAKGIRLIVLKDLGKANLRQAVVEALAPVRNGK
jgi:DNA-binding NtrC family response regulator